MNFYDWMLINSLKKTTASSYTGALIGSLSKWAQEANIFKGSILEISDPIQFRVYAAQIRELDIFLERDKRGHGMYEASLKKFLEYLNSNVNCDVSDDILKVRLDKNIEDTERQSLIKARIGQGLYRQKLINYWEKCSVTGYSDVTILIASHIKPWSVCNNQERMDFYNGLLLLPNLDKLFDRGYISFNEDGNIIISKVLEVFPVLGINEQMSIVLKDKHKEYMQYHRDGIFIRK